MSNLVEIIFKRTPNSKQSQTIYINDGGTKESSE